MTAIYQFRRPISAKRAAAEHGCSERTVRRYVAEAREVFIKRAQQRQATALLLFNEGLSYDEIAQRIDLTPAAVRGLIYRARKNGVAYTVD